MDEAQDGKVEDTIYLKIGLVGNAEESLSVFTVNWNRKMKLVDLETALRTGLSLAADEAADDFGRIFAKHIIETLERRDDDGTEQ